MTHACIGYPERERERERVCKSQAKQSARPAHHPLHAGPRMVDLAVLSLLTQVVVSCTITLAQAQEGTSAPLVQVNFYGEALCPYCARFVDTVAARLFADGVMNLTKFQYIPYGNAKDTKDGVQCQHGPHECELNRILSCAIHLNPDQFVWFPFAKCLESQALGKHHPLEPAEPCAAETGIDYTAVQDCASGALADDLQRQAAHATGSLRPPHSYVPWVTVNGIPIGGAYEQTLQVFICAAYLGDRPEICYRAPWTAAPAVTHAGLTQVLNQLNHFLHT